LLSAPLHAVDIAIGLFLIAMCQRGIARPAISKDALAPAIGAAISGYITASWFRPGP